MLEYPVIRADTDTQPDHIGELIVIDQILGIAVKDLHIKILVRIFKRIVINVCLNTSFYIQLRAFADNDVGIEFIFHKFPIEGYFSKPYIIG